MSVDGVDCAINEPTPFNPGYFSHKFRRAALRYEIGVTMDGEAVLANGPLPPGRIQICGFSDHV